MESGQISILLLVLLSIVLYVLTLWVSARYLSLDEEPPRAVQSAGSAEGIFGVLVWGGLYFIESRAGMAFVGLLGLFWIGLAVSLYRGSRVGRWVCLVLSILRIPTVIGALFSLFTIRKLFFNKEAKDFFGRKTKEVVSS